MDRAGASPPRRKVHDRSMALVLVGMVALLPPVVQISLLSESDGGLAIPFLYIFGVWFLLIVGAAALARPLLKSEDSWSASGTADPET